MPRAPWESPAMFDTAWAELSVAASKTLGIPFSLPALERILDSLMEAYRGDPTVKADGSDFVLSLGLDPTTSREVTLRRFRMQASRGARQTPYYGDLFPRLGLDPARLIWEDVARIPPTEKQTFRDHPYDFVCRDSVVTFVSTTMSTTGSPTRVSFSAHEMQVYMLMGAIANIIIGDIVPDDIQLFSGSSRGTLSNHTWVGACNLIGAVVLHGGVVDPAITLHNLSEKHRFPGKKSRVTLMLIYPSSLGELVELGLERGYGPSDFGLRRIDIGGEVVTQGLKDRARELFGPVPYYEAYGATETWGSGGELCSEGHLHYGMAGGLWEFLNLDTGAPARPGELATAVATPLPPYRETTILLRYDTRDVVRMLEEPPTCREKGTPATSPLLGKAALSVRHRGGWTCPRDVMEALERLECVPLPARFGFWAANGGVTVEVIARGPRAPARSAIRDSMEAEGVPLKALHLREKPRQLTHAYPLRCDLKETSWQTVELRSSRRAA